MCAGVNVFNVVVGDQAGIVKALAVIIAPHGRSRREQAIDELAENRGTQHQFPGHIQSSWCLFLQHRGERGYQYEALEQFGITISVSDDAGARQTVSNHDGRLANDFAHEVADQIAKRFGGIVDSRVIGEAEAQQVDDIDAELCGQRVDVSTPFIR